MKILNLMLILIVLNMAAFSQEILYDGMLEYKTAVIKPEVQAIFERDVFPKASRHFKPDAKCVESINLLDGAAMTVSDSYSEKVYLYNYDCGNPANFSQGIAVIENGKVTYSYAFNALNVHYDHIFYKNGLIVLAGKRSQNSDTSEIVTTVEYAIPIYNDESFSENNFVVYKNCLNNCKTTAKKIYFEYDDGYFFWVEDYQLKDSQWIKVANRKLVEGDTQQLLENFTDLNDKTAVNSSNSSADSAPESDEILNGKAVNLVQPFYPIEAKAAKITGKVEVQVTIDEAGNVISAKMVTGDNVFKKSVEQAALTSKFSPTLLGDKAVKVNGLLVYVFSK